MLDFLKQRRTIRQYTEKAIPAELMTELLNAAAQSSNTGNMQAYSVVVTTTNEIKAQLAPAHFNQPMVTKAPAVLTFCADFNRFSKWCEQRSAVPGYDNFQSFMATAIDAMIFAQTFAVAAESAGLGICYLGTTTYNAGEIIEALNLPKLVVPITTITGGYPEKMPELTDRLPLEAVVHYENTLISAAKKLICFIPKRKQRFLQKLCSRKQQRNTCSGIYRHSYSKKNNEFFSDKFLKVLKQQGFLD
jgi:nitroreductase